MFSADLLMRVGLDRWIQWSRALVLNVEVTLPKITKLARQVKGEEIEGYAVCPYPTKRKAEKGQIIGQCPTREML